MHQISKYFFVGLLVCLASAVFSQLPTVQYPGTNQFPTDTIPDIPTQPPVTTIPGNRPAGETDSQESEIENNEPDSVFIKVPKNKVGEIKGITPNVDSIGIFGHDYLRANNFVFYEKATDVQVDDAYILGPDDNITVSIWNDYDIQSDNFTITEEGYIELPAIFDMSGREQGGFGRIYLAGLSFGKARELLRSQYSNYYTFSREDFELSLSASRTINVNLVGEVEKPGAYKIPAINTVFNALKLTQGPTRKGSVRNIQIKRNGQTIETIDLYNYLMRGETSQNIYLQDNDVVFIPPIGKVVEIDGAVRREMKYELKQNEGLSDLLFYAGGFEASAVKSKAQILRYENDDYVIRDFSYNPDRPASFQGNLYDGDVVMIKRVEKEIENFVVADGALEQPGRFEFVNGMRVTDLIERANGLRYDAFKEKAYIVRYNDDLETINIPVELDIIIDNPAAEENIELYPKDELEILSKEVFADRFNVEIYGQVKKPGRYTFGDNLILQDLLIKAGGFKTDALTQEIELHRVVDYSVEEDRIVPVRNVIDKFSVDYRFLNNDNPAKLMELQPYDQIFVRSIPDFEIPKNVTINGEVKLPGKYPIITKDMRISDLIDQAGGLTPYAYKDGAKFYRETDSTIVREKEVEIAGRTETKNQKINIKVTRPYVIDLNRIATNRSSVHNLVLLPGDRIEVPRVDETVSIGGAIRSEINDTSLVNIAYHGRKNAKWYINNFGAGFDEDALKRSTTVIYPNGQAKGTTKFLFFNVYPEVEPGSDIEVAFKPPKEDKPGFFRDLTAERTLALITSAATTTALILAISRRN